MVALQKLVVGAALLCPTLTLASDQTFDFNIPSFGGNGATSSYYVALLESQKRPQESRDTLSTLDSFTADLERRLLSSLSTEIVNEIFGPDASSAGSFTVGGLDVVFETIDGNVVVTLTDGVSVTEITVPGL